MNVGNWMDTMGIQNPAKTKNSGRGAPAQPAQAPQPAQANWLLPAKTKNSGRGAPAQPAQAPQPAQANWLLPAQANGPKQPATAGTPGKRVRKAPNPEMHLAQLKALLESHGEPVSTLMSWSHSSSAVLLSRCPHPSFRNYLYLTDCIASRPNRMDGWVDCV